jgi:hypothetical protein
VRNLRSVVISRLIISTQSVIDYLNRARTGKWCAWSGGQRLLSVGNFNRHLVRLGGLLGDVESTVTRFAQATIVQNVAKRVSTLCTVLHVKFSIRFCKLFVTLGHLSEAPKARRARPKVLHVAVSTLSRRRVPRAIRHPERSLRLVPDRGRTCLHTEPPCQSGTSGIDSTSRIFSAFIPFHHHKWS